LVGEVEGNPRGFEWGGPQGARDETGGDAGCTQRGGVGRPQGMDGHAGCGNASSLLGLAAGPLDTGAPHGGGRRRALVVIAPGGGQEPGLVTRGLPGGSQQSERLCGQGDVPVLGTLAAVDRDLEALALEVGDLQGEGFMEPEAQALDGGEGDLMVQGGGGLEEPPALLNPADGGETGGRLSAPEREGVPIAREDVLGEAAETAGAETHGSWGEAGDVCAVQEGVLQLLCGEQGGRCARELSPQAYFADRGLLRPFACATEVESRKHGLTQWGHERSPFMS
jgi:hypothetical protein